MTTFLPSISRLPPGTVMLRACKMSLSWLCCTP